MTIEVIARLTFREAYRRKILWAALLLGLAFLIVFGVGLSLMLQDMRDSANPSRAAMYIRQMTNFMLLAGLYSVNFLTVMMTALTSVDTVSGEISSGTIQTLISKPVRRWEVLLGKWLGYCLLISAYLALMAGGVIMIVLIEAGYLPPHLTQGAALLWLNAMVILSLSLLGGTLFSTLTNGVIVFGLYGIAFVGGWVEQIGAFFNNQTAINVGIISSLILPSEALWRRAAYEMQSTLSSLAAGMTPFSPSSVPSPAMILYAVLYTVVLLVLAVRKFNQRDL